MQTIESLNHTFLRDLGDGLILRRSTPDDAEALATFNAMIHSDTGPEQPDETVAAWVRDLMTRPHPTFEPGDFTLVEEALTGKIVSCMNLINQTWSYAGIPFGVGRPELVGTLPEYRNRGLIRAQFDVVHAWSAERGHKVQAITGIPYYYRLFGYEMAANLGDGRAGYHSNVPKLKEGEQEPFLIRPAQEADLDFIAELYTQGARRSLLSSVWDEALWRYELTGKSAKNGNRFNLLIVETPEQNRVGFFAHPHILWASKSMLPVFAYEVKPGISWAKVTPSVVRYLWNTGTAMAAEQGVQDKFDSFGFWLSSEHPAYEVQHYSLPRVRKPYAYYLRVPDLPGFLQHIAPALEAQLAGSPYAGHCGEFKLTFYSDGIRLTLEDGRLAKVEGWKPEPVGHSGDAGFPGLTFLKLLFGHRSVDELDDAFPDCWFANDEIYGLLNALFPKRNSDIWPIA